MRRIFGVLGLAGLLLVGGCAQFPKQAFNREAATHVKAVVIAHPTNQDRYEAIVLGHPGMGFGLIGGLVAAADMTMKSNRLTAAVDPTQVRLQDLFVERVALALTDSGYETTRLAIPRAQWNDELLARVKKQSTASDAAILLDIGGVYIAAGPTTDYQPRLNVFVRKIDLRTGNLLYAEALSYGYPIPQAKTVHFEALPKYRFSDMDKLVADPAVTRDGWWDGMDVIARQIAADLKRR